MMVEGWGRYPKVTSRSLKYKSIQDLTCIVSNYDNLIPYGNGRSYGDSALSEYVIVNRQNKLFLEFNPETGLLNVEAGVLLSEIIEAFVPRGWFLKITPGTKLITIGGAIASDVHGKNHHLDGCFSECIKEFNIMLSDGTVVNCSRNKEQELFRATCGGMGLTGIILNAKIYLKKINSQYINQTTIKTKNLKETFDMFEQYKNYPYSVAWIDCLAAGSSIGRSIIMVGDFSDDGELNYKDKKKISIPLDFPSFTLNQASVKAFNWVYYNKTSARISQQKVNIDTFFYPLDAINNWNRIYGKKGFTQYQFILPIENSYRGLEEILKKISESGKGSFLAVLKLYGKSNNNYISFPMEGYSLALDFKIDSGIFNLLDELDKIVMENNGRIYLAKDVRVSKQTFEKGYPNVDKFRKFRKENKMHKKFQSLQSLRIEL